MQAELKREFERIADERQEADRSARRHRIQFFIGIAAICWIWAVIGLVLVGISFNINATVGGFYFPAAMARAQRYFSLGMFIGTSGPIATLLVGWRRAVARGYLD